MAGTLLRSLLLGATTQKVIAPCIYNAASLHTAATEYAARKGTRAKAQARAKKVKVEVTKAGWIPHNLRKKHNLKVTLIDKHLDDSHKIESPDDVFPMRYHRWVVYPVQEAVRQHQMTHHQTMFNMPEALVFAEIEFNMQAVKKNRFVENFTRIALIPHGFPRDEQRSILAFCKGKEFVDEALQAGATTAGGVEIVKKIQEGEIKLADYDFIIAHPNILTDLVPVRGLMKRRFPSPRLGTLHTDLKMLVNKFVSGIQFKVTKDENQNNFAMITIPIGRVNMEPKQLEENLEAILKDINSARPKRPGKFVTRCFIICPPEKQKLKVDPFVYIPPSLDTEEADSDDEEEEPGLIAVAPVAAAA